MAIKHKRKLNFPDDPAQPEKLNPSDWNGDEHEVIGDLGAGKPVLIGSNTPTIGNEMLQVSGDMSVNAGTLKLFDSGGPNILEAIRAGVPQIGIDYTTQFFINTSAGPLYFGNYMNPAGNFAGYSMPGTYVFGIHTDTLNVVIGQTASETPGQEKLQVVGAASFGNSSSGANATIVEADGTVKFIGDATVWGDLLGAITAIKVLGSGVSINDAEETIDFTTGASLSDYAWVSYQLTHAWKLGSDIYPHIHWEQTSNAVPNFLIRFRWQKGGNAKTTTWTDYVCNTPAYTYVSGTLNQICYGAAITPPAGYQLSDIIQTRIYRDNSNASTAFAGADGYTGTVSITGADIHVEKDTVDSRTQYSK